MTKLSEIKDLLPYPIMPHDPRLCLPDKESEHNTLLREIGNRSIEINELEGKNFIKSIQLLSQGDGKDRKWNLTNKQSITIIKALNASLGSLIRVKS